MQLWHYFEHYSLKIGKYGIINLLTFLEVFRIVLALQVYYISSIPMVSLSISTINTVMFIFRIFLFPTLYVCLCAIT